MDTVLSVVGAVVAAVVGLGSLWARHREIADGESRRILRDIEILDALPDGNAGKVPLEAAIGDAVMSMLANRTVRKRNGTNIGIGVFFLVITAVLVVLIVRGGWWWALLPLVVFTLALGAYGTIEGLMKAERDARGNIVRAKDRRARR